MNVKRFFRGDMVVLREELFKGGQRIMHGVRLNGEPCLYSHSKVYTVEEIRPLPKFDEDKNIGKYLVTISGMSTSSTWWRHATNVEIGESA